MLSFPGFRLTHGVVVFLRCLEGSRSLDLASQPLRHGWTRHRQGLGLTISAMPSISKQTTARCRHYLYFPRHLALPHISMARWASVRLQATVAFRPRAGWVPPLPREPEFVKYPSYSQNASSWLPISFSRPRNHIPLSFVYFCSVRARRDRSRDGPQNEL